MIWLKFSLWLCLLYGIYYAVIIFWDVKQSRRTTVDNADQELAFAVEMDNVQTVPGPPSIGEIASAIISSGGVNLKQAFALAREESIEYIRGVSF